MFVPIQEMADTSRAWIYQSSQPFNNTEAIKKEIQQFTESWTAHNQKLRASGDLLYNRFVVLLVDEASAAQASGCSIDSSVHFVQSLEQKHRVNLFDRQQLAYMKENQIDTISLSELKKAAEQGILTEDTIVFNNMVSNKRELDSNWRVPVKKVDWLQRFLPHTEQ